MRSARVLVAVLVMLFAMSACDAGDDDTGAEDSPAESTSTSESAVEVDEEPETVSVFDLEPGMCIESIGAAQGSSIEEVDVVDCDAAHEAEVFSVFDIEGDEDDVFPGSESVDNTAAMGCEERYEGYVGIPFQDSRYQATYLAPNEQTWAQDDREVVCVAFADDGEMNGSIEGSEE